MTKLTDDGELAHPIDYSEKPKRGVPVWRRSVSVPCVVPLLLGLVAVCALTVTAVVNGWQRNLDVIGQLTESPQALLPEDLTERVARIRSGLPDPAPTAVGSCAASPLESGERIAYVERNADTYPLYIFDPDTDLRCAALTLPNNLTEFTWSPDGEQIAYTRQEDGISDLWIIDLRRNLRHNLTELISAYVRYPAWSPDGTRIAFTAVEDYSVTISLIDVTNATVQSLVMGSMPAWSRDGAGIAFLYDSDIHVMNVDGSNVRRLTDNPTPERDPVWSPDGTQILFSRETSPGTYGAVYAISVDDTPQEQQLFTVDGGAVEAEWLPDGSFAYLVLGRGLIHRRTAPANADADGLILANVIGYDWWSPP